MRGFPLCLTLAAVVASSAAWGAPQAPASPPTAETRRKLAAELDGYLFEHVLKPRFPRCVDREHGGFHTFVALFGRPVQGDASTRSTPGATSLRP